MMYRGSSSSLVEIPHSECMGLTLELKSPGSWALSSPCSAPHLGAGSWGIRLLIPLSSVGQSVHGHMLYSTKWFF